jgi:hypothetical protein
MVSILSALQRIVVDLYPPGRRVDTRKIDFGSEIDLRCYVRILIAASNFQAVNSVLMSTLSHKSAYSSSIIAVCT